MAENKINFNKELKIFIFQFVAVLIIILAVFFVKFFNGNWFEYLKGFYVTNFLAETSSDEVVITEEENTIYLNSNFVEASVVRLNNPRDFRNELICPIKKAIITSGYGIRNNPFGNGLEFHKGIDLVSDASDIILSAASGTVEKAEYSNSYGNYIVINHSGGLKTLYAHCSSLLKKAGEKVNVGEAVAIIGSTGHSTGTHLHFEVILKDNNLNPQWLITENAD